jgi:hypothetical protein
MRDREQHSEVLAGEAGFDESDGLRETVAYRLGKADREALRDVVRTLDTLTLEAGRCWGEIGEPAVAEARAAAVDLRHVQGFLGRLAENGRGADPAEEPERARSARAARRLAPAVGRIAAALEGLLPEASGSQSPAAGALRIPTKPATHSDGKAATQPEGGDEQGSWLILVAAFEAAMVESVIFSGLCSFFCC